MLEPQVEFAGVKAQEVPPFEEGNASLGDESTNVANGDTKVFGNVLDGHESR
jgi:hypothetical protein